jgi:uncharacterized protein (TIGR02284 family)
MSRLPLPGAAAIVGGLLTVLVGCGAELSRGSGLEKVKMLHRGELSAVATYDQAIGKVKNAAIKPDLTRLRDEHQDAVNRLRARITEMGGTPDEKAGLWGDWSKLVTDAAAVFGDDAALGALKAGEKHGISEYEETLKADVDSTTKALVRDVLLPRQREHVPALETLAKAQ